MAILNDDEENAKNQQNPTGGGTGYVGGGYTNSGQGGMAPVSARPSSDTGSNFTSINDYLNAGNNAGSQMAGEIAGQTDTLGDKATTSTQAYNTAWNRAADTNQPTIQNGVAGSATYTGPTVGGSNDYGFSGAQQDVANVNAQTKNYGTAGGISSLIAGLHPSGPSFTAGENALDTALVGAEGRNTLNDSSHKWGGVSDYLGAAQKDTAAHTQAGMNRATDVNAAWQAYTPPAPTPTPAPAVTPKKATTGKGPMVRQPVTTTPTTTAAPAAGTLNVDPTDYGVNYGTQTHGGGTTPSSGLQIDETTGGGGTLEQTEANQPDAGSTAYNTADAALGFGSGVARTPSMPHPMTFNPMVAYKGGKVPNWSELTRYMRR